MKKETLTLLLLLVFSSPFAQTKLIHHKSHSGSKANFSKAFSENLFDIGESNFGMAPQRHVRNSNLDTVKLLSPNVAVMVTSESCHWEEYDGRDKSVSQLWSAGTDTVYDHPVFNAKNSITEIKQTLKKEYYFSNSVDRVVFIGFDGNYAVVEPKKDIPEQEKDAEPAKKNEDPSTKKRPSYFMIIIMALLSSIFKTPFN